jgi:hypothetical protein
MLAFEASRLAFATSNAPRAGRSCPPYRSCPCYRRCPSAGRSGRRRCHCRRPCPRRLARPRPRPARRTPLAPVPTRPLRLAHPPARPTCPPTRHQAPTSPAPGRCTRGSRPLRPSGLVERSRPRRPEIEATTSGDRGHDVRRSRPRRPGIEATTSGDRGHDDRRSRPRRPEIEATTTGDRGHDVRRSRPRRPEIEATTSGDRSCEDRRSKSRRPPIEATRTGDRSHDVRRSKLRGSGIVATRSGIEATQSGDRSYEDRATGEESVTSPDGQKILRRAMNSGHQKPRASSARPAPRVAIFRAERNETVACSGFPDGDRGEGNACYPCEIVCPGAAINAGAKGRYLSDVAKTSAADLVGVNCGCPVAFNPCCRGGTCYADFQCQNPILSGAGACAAAGGQCVVGGCGRLRQWRPQRLHEDRWLPCHAVLRAGRRRRRLSQVTRSSEFVWFIDSGTMSVAASVL